MARPKSMPSEPEGELAATERETASETAVAERPQYVPPQPLTPSQMSVERQGATGAPLVRHFPEVRGGVCERCGVLDKDVPSQFQYQMCPHYRGMQLACSYCPSTTDPNEVVRSTVLHITSHPYNPSQLVVVCDRYECVKAHRERFQVSR